MKAVVQVVNHAKLSVNNEIISKIGQGMVVFFCVEKGDLEEKLGYFAKKIANLRIFCDENGKMNLSVRDICGEILLVSQFTLAGDCSHGNRPSFINAELPEKANLLYQKFGKIIEEDYEIKVSYGKFGEDMKILQENSGPVTIILNEK